MFSFFARRPTPIACPFDGEAEWADLLRSLTLPPTSLREVLASGELHPHFHYRRFTKRKPGGGVRRLAAPDSKLLRIQREIASRYLEQAPVHPAAVAYRRGKSTADHAWAHAGAEWVAAADVRDFFPSTSAWRVESWFRRAVRDEGLARLLTILTTDAGGLPQGAPTSPPLSNLVNVELDENLAALAAESGARYSRFCDDLAFSWRSREAPPADARDRVQLLLRSAGYEPHAEKGWRLSHRTEEPTLVGVVLTANGRVRLPAAMLAEVRRLDRRDPADAARLQGYRGYESMMTRRSRRSD